MRGARLHEAGVQMFAAVWHPDRKCAGFPEHFFVDVWPRVTRRSTTRLGVCLWRKPFVGARVWEAVVEKSDARLAERTRCAIHVDVSHNMLHELL